jgi:DNA helicase-2/ATP-dependent DNA helicase PcrA
VADRGELRPLLEAVLEETGYELALKNSKSIEDLARLDNLDELRGALADWAEAYPNQGLNEWLAEQALVADVDKYNPEADSVTLMTLHAAKGLEFEVVFLPGMEEGILPHFRSMEEGTDAEEMRLAYVGCTRAKQQLFLSAAQVRRFQGDLRQQLPSRFLRSLTPDHLAGDERHLMLLTSELSGGGWSQESGTNWRRGVQAQMAADDSYGRRPSWGARDAQREPWEIAEPLPGEETSRRAANRGLSIEQSLSDRPKARPATPTEPAKFAAGDRVRHATWGDGVVTSVSAAGRDYFVSIQFPDVGVKMLSESKAPIEKI